MSEARTVRTVRYLDRTPREPRTDGLLVVHNHLRLDSLDFRAWLAELPDTGRTEAALARLAGGRVYRVEPCSCGWAAEAGPHWRVAR